MDNCYAMDNFSRTLEFIQVADEKRFMFHGRGIVPKTVHGADPAPLTPDAALRIIKRSWLFGRIQWTDHFRRRCRERGFEPIDAENAIRGGRMRGELEFCPIFSNWKCRIIGEVEDRQLEIVLALDPTQDYEESPLIVPITGYWK